MQLPTNYDQLNRQEQAKIHFTRIFTALQYDTNRDAWQSLFANRGRVEDKIPVAVEENNLVLIAREELLIPNYSPVAEYWGGGEVSQPAEFNGQNSFKNLRLMAEKAQNVFIQALYRGRQAFGFYPVSDELQEKAINKAVDNGLRSLRVFDMMNDPENMKTGIKAFIERSNREVAEGRPALKLEACLSYISPPSDGSAPAWTDEDYANFAIDLVKIVEEVDPNYLRSGNFSITDKDYAGQHVDNKMISMLRTVRARLNEAGYDYIGINLHSHGRKPDLIVQALNEGLIVKADVAAGELSNGSSHTNAIEVVDTYMKSQGFSREDYEQLKTFQQMEVLEKTANFVTKRYASEKFNEAIATIDQVLKSKLAGGAIAALWSTAKKAFPLEKAKIFFDKVREHNPMTWMRGGQFNTVTPGALICSNQAIVECQYDNTRSLLPLGKHDQQYKDVVMGRYGRNLGMEKGLGDQDLRKAYLIESCIQLIIKKDKNNLGDVLEHTDLGIIFKTEKEVFEKLKEDFENGNREKISPMMLKFFEQEAEIERLTKNLENLTSGKKKNAKPTEDISITQNALEELEKTKIKFTPSNERIADILDNSVLFEDILRGADIEKFRKAIQYAGISRDLKNELDYFSKPNRFPKPTQTLQQGFDLLAIAEQKFNLQIPAEEREELALLMMLTRKELATDKNAQLMPGLGLSEALKKGLIREVDDFSVGVNLARHLFGEKGKYGKIEAERIPEFPRLLLNLADKVAVASVNNIKEPIGETRKDLEKSKWALSNAITNILKNNKIEEEQSKPGSVLHNYYLDLIERSVIQKSIAEKMQPEKDFILSSPEILRHIEPMAQLSILINKKQELIPTFQSKIKTITEQKKDKPRLRKLFETVGGLVGFKFLPSEREIALRNPQAFISGVTNRMEECREELNGRFGSLSDIIIQKLRTSGLGEDRISAESVLHNYYMIECKNMVQTRVNTITAERANGHVTLNDDVVEVTLTRQKLEPNPPPSHQRSGL